MITETEVEEIILQALREAVRGRIDVDGLEVSGTTPLFGRESALESLELVSMIVDIENVLLEKCGREICLADDRALGRAESPFASVAALRDYVLELVTGS